MMEVINDIRFINLLLELAYDAGKEGTRCPGYAATEQVIRCRDCEKLIRDSASFDYIFCKSRYFCKKFGIEMEDDNGFCAWGRKKK